MRANARARERAHARACVCCACNQGIADIPHFLFECLKFTTHRASLAVTVTDIQHRNKLTEPANNLGLYLYDHPSPISVDNK